MRVARVRLDSSSDPAWPVAEATSSLVLRDAALWRDGGVVRTFAGVADALAWLDAERRGDDGYAWVGFVSYEAGFAFEPKARVRTERATGVPVVAFVRVSLKNKVSLLTPHRSAVGLSGETDVLPKHWTSTFTRETYERAVARCVEYVRAGDVFQVNLSQTLTTTTASDAWGLYARLPGAVYGGVIDLGDVAVVSNSPELFLRVDADGVVTTRPIKGTRPPGGAAELLHSAKDAAELNMIVDLERNDLGRVCETGSVRVSAGRSVETHPTVHHGAATITGTLRRGVGLVELLAATFPGGSVTGAPKIRAMQIIDELEPVPRGPYCGALGRLDADGSMTLNVAIRTATLAGGVVRVPVGGGVVADSVPADEYAETLVKARAFLEAVV